MALGVIIRISAFEYLPAQQRHTWSLCFSLSIGISVRNNSLIVVPAHLQVRQDWLEANVFYSKHYLLDARSRDVTEERRAFSSIPRSDYRLSKLFHSYPKFPRTTLETSGTMTPYLATKYDEEEGLAFYDRVFLRKSEYLEICKAKNVWRVGSPLKNTQKLRCFE